VAGTKRSQRKKEEFLHSLRENYKISVDGDSKIYQKSLEDMKFVYDVDGAQWPDGMDSNIKLTANNILKFVRNVRADARQNRPRLRVVPVDDLGDVRMAELRNGLMRQIEHLSNASVAYDTAYMQSVTGSIGYFRIVTEFESEDSFNQQIRIKRIRNPYTVHFDPGAREFNKEDARWCFIEDYMPRGEFKDKYPNAEMSDFDAQSQGQAMEGWFEKDKVRIAEYYYKVKTPFTLSLVERRFEDGSTRTEAMEITDEVKDFIKRTKANVLKDRESFRTEVKWAKVTGVDVLEETDFPTQDIPVIAVQGDEIVIDGETHLLSFTRGAHDLQRMLNFWLTKATKIMAKAPDAPFLLTDGQIEGHENEWNQPNALDRAFLRYNETAAGKPSREQPIPPPIGMLAMIGSMDNGIENHLGVFESFKGAPSNERSNVAIQTRIGQSQKGSFVFVDNYARALIHANKIINRLIPKIYDTQRALQVMGEGGDVSVERFNAPTGEVNAENNPVIANDLSVGSFDIIETLGVSSVSRRQEERQDLLAAMQYAGPVAPALLPFIFKLSDSPNSQEITKAVADFMSAMQEGQQKPQGGSNGG